MALIAHPHLPLLVSSSTDRTVRVWDLETRRCLRTLTGHRSFIFGLALDSAGCVLTSGSDDCKVRLWDLNSGACFDTIVDEWMREVRAVVWDWSGALVASGSFDSLVRVWDAASGVLQHGLEGHSDWVYTLAAHPADDLLASGSNDKSVRVWRWSSGECVCVLKGHERAVCSLAASAAWLVSGSEDKRVRVWSWTSGECVRVLDGFAGLLSLNSLAWRDSTLVVLESDGAVRVWDASSADPSAWECVGSLPSKASSSYGVAAVGSGRVACAAPDDSTTIAVWDV